MWEQPIQTTTNQVAALQFLLFTPEMGKKNKKNKEYQRSVRTLILFSLLRKKFVLLPAVMSSSVTSISSSGALVSTGWASGGGRAGGGVSVVVPAEEKETKRFSAVRPTSTTQVTIIDIIYTSPLSAS